MFMAYVLSKVAGYLPEGMGGDPILLPLDENDLSGVFKIMKDGKEAGEIYICRDYSKTYVSVRLVDTFLTLSEMNALIQQLKNDFDLSWNQEISIEQI